MTLTSLPFELRRPRNKEERRLLNLLENGTPEERRAEYDALQARFEGMTQEEYETDEVDRLVCFQGLLVED